MLDIPQELLQDPQRLRSADGSSGRDGCRVPLPWRGTEPPFGFSPLDPAEAWLPAPRAWSALTVEAQRGDAASTWELYRRALEIRRDLPALGDGALAWHTAPDGVLVFRRAPGFVCTVNTGDEPVALPRPGKLLLASAPMDAAAEPAVHMAGGAHEPASAPVADDEVLLPPNTTAWWSAA